MRLAAIALAVLSSICLVVGAGLPATAHAADQFAGQSASQAHDSNASVPGYGEKGPTSPPATPAYRNPGRSGDPTGLSGSPQPYNQGEAMGGSAQPREFSGRLVRMGGGFGLVAKDGKAFALHDGPREMARLVGQEVTVQGSLTGAMDAGKRSVIDVTKVRPAK
jgi:hypothetical protein